MEGEEIERGYARWPKATNRGRRPPAREASVPAPQGPRRRAAERLELLVFHIRPTYNILLQTSVVGSIVEEGRICYNFLHSGRLKTLEEDFYTVMVELWGK